MLAEGGRGGLQRFAVAAGQLFADLFLAGLRVGPGLGDAGGRRFQAGRQGFQRAGLRLRLRGEVARGLGQGVADFELADGGLRAGLFPFLGQARRHRGQRAGPGGQAFLVARGQRVLQLRVRLVQRAQQGGRLPLESRGGVFERLLVVVGQLGIDLFLAPLGVGPGLGDAGGRRFRRAET